MCTVPWASAKPRFRARTTPSRAAQRRAMRDLQYGSDEQKAAAREWLRQNKQQQNAAE